MLGHSGDRREHRFETVRHDRVNFGHTGVEDQPVRHFLLLGHSGHVGGHPGVHRAGRAGDLSTGFDAELFLRLPGAIGVDGPVAAHMGDESTETGTFTTGEETTEMSTEVTPESLRTHARWAKERGKSYTHTASDLTDLATLVEQEQRRPLPTKAGWYELIVVERDGEKCTGAFRDTSGYWHTSDFTVNGASPDVTIRWAEQSGTTPGQTLREAASAEGKEWPTGSPFVNDQIEHFARVLTAHGTTTLTPVGWDPKPGTRGLLPVVATHGGVWETPSGWIVEDKGNRQRRVLADPRPGGAQ